MHNKHVASFFTTHKVAVRVVFVLVVFLALLGYLPRCISTKVCGNTLVDRIVRTHATIVAPQAKLSVEVVNTPESRELGLSGRSGISDKHGMLFVFPSSGSFGFWMKDMKFPIDMVWINKDGVIVYIVENAKPEDYPATYVNQPEALYVLELGANKAREYGMYLGVKLQISGQN